MNIHSSISDLIFEWYTEVGIFIGKYQILLVCKIEHFPLKKKRMNSKKFSKCIFETTACTSPRNKVWSFLKCSLLLHICYQTVLFVISKYDSMPIWNRIIQLDYYKRWYSKYSRAKNYVFLSELFFFFLALKGSDVISTSNTIIIYNMRVRHAHFNTEAELQFYIIFISLYWLIWAIGKTFAKYKQTISWYPTRGMWSGLNSKT